MEPEVSYAGSVSELLAKDVAGRSVVDATPKAHSIFLGLARSGYTVPGAVAEYVDNAIEQAKNSGRGSGSFVRVSVRAHSPKIAIEIHDDAGGCPRSQAIRFIQPGLSGVDPSASAISRFGLGGKAAGLSIADQVIIVSRVKGEAGWRVILDKDEILSKVGWDFAVSDLPESVHLEEGQTKIVLITSDRSAHAMFPHRYLAEFAERYSFLFGEGCPKIYVGSQEIHRVNPRDEMLTTAEAPQLCGPREFGFEKTYRIITPERPPEQAKVRFKMSVGVLPHGTAGAQYGAHIYCNGRLLVRNSSIGLIDDDFDVREKHPASVEVWLRAIVEVDGPSEAMPWTHRKDNVDNSSESYRDLRSFMATCYEKFMEENLGEARRRLRARSGARGLPTVRDLLKDSFLTKLQKKQLDRVHVRALIAQAGAFQEAAQSLASPDEVPPAPKKQTEVTLQAAIQSWKVDRMKVLIRQKFGNEVVHNTDVVRVAVDHYIECVEGTDEKLEEE